MTFTGLFSSAGTLWEMSVTCTSRQRCQPTRARTSTVRTSLPTPLATTTNTRVRTTAVADSVTAIGPVDSTRAIRAVFSEATSRQIPTGELSISYFMQHIHEPFRTRYTCSRSSKLTDNYG